MRSVPTKAQIARAMKGYRYAAGADAESAARAIGRKAETIYKYESARLEMPIADIITLLTMYGVDLDSAFEGPLPAPKGRKKNSSALKLRKIEEIFEALPAKGRDDLFRAAKWIAAYYAADAALPPFPQPGAE